jgi:dihydropteroate synthase
MDATPSVRLPSGAGHGIAPRPPAPLTVHGRRLEWGSRTFVMGIINVTPDSFSGDGLLKRAGDGATVDDALVDAALEQARAMAADGADLLDIGGQSTRPGHVEVGPDEELRRVLPVVGAVRAVLPEMPISIDTTRDEVAAPALDAGADLINDVWATGDSDALARLAARRGAAMVLMHNRAEPIYRNVVGEVLTDLGRALDRAVAAGVDWERLIIDPGIGFGKTADQNLVLLRELAALTALGRPILLGTSRKSTIGRVLDLPAGERVEGTLATTALGIAGGVDIVRVHDVRANVRVARMADAVVRGNWHEAQL